MNDQSHMMNQPPPPPPQMMNPVQVPAQIMNQNPALVQSQPMNQPVQVMMNQNQSQLLGHNQVMNQQQSMMMMMMMNQHGSYKPWLQQQQSSMDPNNKFQNQQNPYKFNKKPKSNNMNGNPNWKGKNVNKDQRRMDKPLPNKPINNTNPTLTASGGGPSGAGGYKPPSLSELQNQNRMKARKYYYPKKKFNNRFAPYAPRNTSSFIIRAKKSGGIAELVSPCPVTPAVLPTPIFSPSREVLGDMAKEEWGVDGYGSMKGLIRLRSPSHEAEVHDDEEEDEGNGSSESDVEEHVEVERRLDHDLSRFEMICPTYAGDYSYNNVLENRVDDQDTHIAQLEEENLTLKERLFLMERELGDLRRRLQFLERHQGQSSSGALVEDVNEEVVENMYENSENENESDGGLDATATGVENNEEVMEDVGGKEEGRNINIDVKEEINNVCMEGVVSNGDVILKHELVDEKAGNVFMVKDEVIVKKNEIKGGEIGDALMAKGEPPQVEEMKTEGALERSIPKEEGEQMSRADDDCTGKEIVQD